MNFNPRTHVGCDIGGKYAYLTILISIHAPTWGATILEVCSAMSKAFQSTHPRGVRLFLFRYPSDGGDFNPRTHVGCDSAVQSNIPAKSRISIHAPTWGATTTKPIRSAYLAISIHAPTWGATRSLLHCLSILCYFNPRTHVGCDFN